ncbi:hypothetical protein FSP39_011783 [Pinctada imbricata]|uniref:Calmodulin n=1 Tax=Pinctada imbricata TaxID=66713 RepID=A0AA88XR71_PINIB|nr:hypothetical protein FSP39_011783 [Pinctada imbricata]
MPGEQLACLLPAIHAIMKRESNQVQVSTGIPYRGFKALLGKLSALLRPAGDLSLDKDNEMTFVECKRIIDKFSIPNQPASYYDKIEDACFEVCRDTYEFDMSEENIRKLWRIANRLLEEGIYPPRIPFNNAAWIFAIFNQRCDSVDEDFMKASYFDHTEFLCTVAEVCEKLTRDEVGSTIDKLYSFLVLANIKYAWSYRRTKHKRDIDWTNWKRIWLILKSDRLDFFNHNAVNRRSKSSQTFEIRTNSRVADLPCYRGSVHNSRFRFKLTDGHWTECELAFENAEEKMNWIACIDHVIHSIGHDAHPISGLLDSSLSTVSHGVSSISELYHLSLNASHLDLTALEGRRQLRKCHLDRSRQQEDEKQRTTNMTIGIQSLFMDIDSNGDQAITMDEIQSFANKFKISADEARHIFRVCDRERKGKIDIDEFEKFFKRYVLKGKMSGKFVSVFRDTFKREKRISSAALKCKEFAAHMYNRQHSIRTRNIFHGLEELHNMNRDEITKEDFAEFLLNSKTKNVKSLSEVELFDNLRQKLEMVYEKEEVDELVQYVQNRWKMFLKFRRKGISGKVVMTCGHGTIEGLTPGNYHLNGLANFRDLPPLIPKHTFVAEVKWDPSPDHSRPGQLIFPSSFNKEIRTEIATNEYLSFYGCRFADSSEIEISLDQKHWIQDFQYNKDYLAEFVGAVRGGSTLERHEFPHLDCPLEEDSGYFILGKMTETNGMYLTAFRIPLRHTLFVPSNCIHTNDYLKGTWRTMLAEEAHIDDVFLCRTTATELEKFSFSFA